MEKGDISNWASPRIIVVLEGVLCRPVPPHKRIFARKATQVEADPGTWSWETIPVQKVVDYGGRLNVPVEVVTFMGQAIADAAADWMARYDIEVTSVEAVDFDWFCRSLRWRQGVRVVDTDPERIQHYGQAGYLTMRGQEF